MGSTRSPQARSGHENERDGESSADVAVLVWATQIAQSDGLRAKAKTRGTVGTVGILARFPGQSARFSSVPKCAIGTLEIRDERHCRDEKERRWEKCLPSVAPLAPLARNAGKFARSARKNRLHLLHPLEIAESAVGGRQKESNTKGTIICGSWQWLDEADRIPPAKVPGYPVGGGMKHGRSVLSAGPFAFAFIILHFRSQVYPCPKIRFRF